MSESPALISWKLKLSNEFKSLSKNLRGARRKSPPFIFSLFPRRECERTMKRIDNLRLRALPSHISAHHLRHLYIFISFIMGG